MQGRRPQQPSLPSQGDSLVGWGAEIVLGPAFLVTAAQHTIGKLGGKLYGEGQKQNRKTTVSEVNITEKVRHHRSPSRNHNHFLEEDIKKEKPQPKVQRELKKKQKNLLS